MIGASGFAFVSRALLAFAAGVVLIYASEAVEGFVTLSLVADQAANSSVSAAVTAGGHQHAWPGATHNATAMLMNYNRALSS